MTSAQHHERVSYSVSLTQGKIKIQSVVPTERVSLSYHRKVKKL